MELAVYRYWVRWFDVTDCLSKSIRPNDEHWAVETMPSVLSVRLNLRLIYVRKDRTMFRWSRENKFMGVAVPNFLAKKYTHSHSRQIVYLHESKYERESTDIITNSILILRILFMEIYLSNAQAGSGTHDFIHPHLLQNLMICKVLEHTKRT